MPPFSVAPVRHRALGPLVRLRLGCSLTLDLTDAEAATLSRALAAVHDGRSAERTVFLSPVASDGDFTATVEGTGVTVAGTGSGIHLAWPTVRDLSRALAAGA